MAAAALSGWARDFMARWTWNGWLVRKDGNQWHLSGPGIAEEYLPFNTATAAALHAREQHYSSQREIYRQARERAAKRSQAAHKAWATRRGKTRHPEPTNQQPQTIIGPIFKPGELEALLKPKTLQEKVDDITDDTLQDAATKAKIDANAVELRIFLQEIIEDTLT